MTSRWAVTAALAGVCTITAVSVSPSQPTADNTPPPPAHASVRQYSDVKPALPPMAAAQPVPALPDSYDVDMPDLRINFGHAELDALVTSGTTTVNLPGQAPVALALITHQVQHGIERISASHAGLTTTITRRGTRFFATLATPTESYRLENDGSGSRIYPQRLLAARTIRHEKDFRHAQ